MILMLFKQNASDGNAGYLFADDLGNGHVNAYFTKDVSVAASKTTSYVKDTTIIVALYLIGVNTAYINRSANRGTVHEICFNFNCLRDSNMIYQIHHNYKNYTQKV